MSESLATRYRVMPLTEMATLSWAAMSLPCERFMGSECMPDGMVCQGACDSRMSQQQANTLSAGLFCSPGMSHEEWNPIVNFALDGFRCVLNIDVDSDFALPRTLWAVIQDS